MTIYGQYFIQGSVYDLKIKFNAKIEWSLLKYKYFESK